METTSVSNPTSTAVEQQQPHILSNTMGQPSLMENKASLIPEQTTTLPSTSTAGSGIGGMAHDEVIERREFISEQQPITTVTTTTTTSAVRPMDRSATPLRETEQHMITPPPSQQQTIFEQPATNVLPQSGSFRSVQTATPSYQPMVQPTEAQMFTSGSFTQQPLMSTSQPVVIQEEMPGQFVSSSGPATGVGVGPIVSTTSATTVTTVNAVNPPVATIQRTASDRYGHKSIIRSVPFPPLDMPCYIKSAEEKVYLELPYEKTHLALDQQVIVGKKGFFEGLSGGYSRHRWILTSDGYIVSEVNRHVMLTVKKSRITNEWLVMARNTEVIGGTIPRWKVREAEVSPLIPMRQDNICCYICLEADPTLVLDVQKNPNIDTPGYNVVLRKNLNGTDLRQKWAFKFKV